MIIRKTKPEEGQRVNELFAIAFELPAETGPSSSEDNGTVCWAAFADDDKTMMSTLSVTDFQIRFDGNISKMGGMGGAASLPQYRRQGGIRGCFQAMLPDMYANGYDFSYLYPFSTAYYRKFGYECSVRRFQVRLDLELLKPRNVGGELVLAEGTEFLDEIRSVWEAYEEKFNLSALHTNRSYKWAKEFAPATQQEFTYLYRSPGGKAKALATCRLSNDADGRNIVCKRFCFLDQEGFDGLMQLLKSQAGSHKYAKFTLPFENGYMYLFPEWTLGAVDFEVVNAGMVRVVNAASVLKKAKYLGNGSIMIGITDTVIPENNGTYRVEFADGRATCVEMAAETADICMDAAKFSAAITGSFAARELAILPGVTVNCGDEVLSKVFYRKPMHITDYF